MVAQRYLIVNADDFGLSRGVNQGIIEAFEHGIVTSASLMVRWPAAAAAAAYAREQPLLSLGLHVDLCEWAYRDGTWVRVYEVVPMNDMPAVTEEVAAQMDTFRRLMGQDPTHLDSHQHVHRDEPVRAVLLKIARALAIPLRHYSPEIRYCGDFYGQTAKGWPCPEAISVEALARILTALPCGTTELGCHPAKSNDMGSTYGSERVEELRSLCDPRVREVLAAEGIQLRSFRSINQDYC